MWLLDQPEDKENHGKIAGKVDDSTKEPVDESGLHPLDAESSLHSHDAENGLHSHDTESDEEASSSSNQNVSIASTLMDILNQFPVSADLNNGEGGMFLCLHCRC